MSALRCKDVDERLLDYLYEELAPSEMDEVARHVAGCARCQAEVASFRRVRHAAQALDVEEPAPGGVTARLLEAAAAQLASEGLVAAAAGAPHLRLVSSQPAVEVQAAPAPAPARVEPKRQARRPLRWLFHPAFAAAASFVVVGAGSYLLVNHRSAEMTPSAAVVAEAPAATAVEAKPAVAPAPAAANEPVKKNLEAEKLEVKESPTFAMDVRERAAAKSKETIAIPKPEPALAMKKKVVAADDDMGDLLNSASAGYGKGAGGGAVAGRVARAEPDPSPAKPRAPSGHGVWLGKDQNDVLARSIEATPEAAPAAPAAAAPVAAAPPPPPTTPRPAPSSRAAVANSMQAQLQDREPASEAKRDAPSYADKKASQAPSQVAESRAVKTPAEQPVQQQAQKAEAQGGMVAMRSDVQERVAQFRSAVVSLGNCPQAIERYREVRGLDSNYRFSAKDRLDVAKCLRALGRYDEARVELYALRDDAPGKATEVNRELQMIAESEVAQRSRSQQATSTPSVHAAPKRAAPAKAAPPAPAKAKQADEAAY